MKKIIAIITPLFLLLTVAAKAEVGVGITGAMHFFDGTGTETTRTSAQKNTGAHTHDVLVPEIFVEAIADGLTLGLSFIPTREMGSKSRKDTNSDGDTGTYTGKAELANVVQIYADLDIPIGYPVYVKLGAQHVTLKTLESLNSGTTYPDKDLLGFTVGLGTKGDVPGADNMYYKAEVTYTEFESYNEMGSAQNKLEADFEDTAAKISIGYKF